jgi:hypothetical protein
MRVVRGLVLVLVAGSFLLVPIRPGLAAGPEGCVATNPPSPAAAQTCTYKATIRGRFEAGGLLGAHWKVTIRHGRKSHTIKDTPSDVWTRKVAIKPGDSVTATALTPGSWVLVGECPVNAPNTC